MNPHRVNILAWSAVVVGVVAAPVLLYTGIFSSLDTVESSKPTTAMKPGDLVKAAPTQIPSLESFEPVVLRSLRGGTVREGSAPPANPTQTVAVVDSSSRLQLIGTVGTSVAIFKGPDGSVAMAVVGDEVDGAELMAIRPSQVDLRRNGRVTTLQKPATATPEAAGVVIR